MSLGTKYKALSIETLPERLKGVDVLASKVGADSAAWQVQEVGDGNLNLVFIVTGPEGKAVVKQALPLSLIHI